MTLSAPNIPRHPKKDKGKTKKSIHKNESQIDRFGNSMSEKHKIWKDTRGTLLSHKECTSPKRIACINKH